MKTFRVFIAGMPHQDVQGTGFEVDDKGVLFIYGEEKNESSGWRLIDPVASFRDWTFIRERSVQAFDAGQDAIWVEDKPKKFVTR